MGRESRPTGGGACPGRWAETPARGPEPARLARAVATARGGGGRGRDPTHSQPPREDGARPALAACAHTAVVALIVVGGGRRVVTQSLPKKNHRQGFAVPGASSPGRADLTARHRLRAARRPP